MCIPFDKIKSFLMIGVSSLQELGSALAKKVSSLLSIVFNTDIRLLLLLTSLSFLILLLLKNYLPNHLIKLRRKNKAFEEFNSKKLNRVPFSSLNFPSFKSFQIVFLVLLSIILALDLWLSRSLPNTIFCKLDNLLAITIAASSILFPLILLVLQRDSSGEQIVPFYEILLVHSFAFPASVCLLSSIGFFIIVKSPATLSIIAIFSLLVAGLVLYKLFRVVIMPGIRWDAEENILKGQTRILTSDILSHRSKVKEFSKTIKDRYSKLVDFFPYSAFSDKSLETLKVPSKKVGIVKKVQVTRIVKFLKKELNIDLKIAGQKDASDTISDSSVDSPTKPSFQLFVYPGAVIKKNDEPLAEFKEMNELNNKRAEKIIHDCIQFEEFQDDAKLKFQEYISSLYKLSNRAIAEKDELLFNKVSKSLEIILRGFIEALEQNKQKHTIEELRKKDSDDFGLYSWTALDFLKDIILQQNTLLIESDIPTDHKIKKEIEILPYKFAGIALRNKEALVFREMLSLSNNQAFLSLKDKTPKVNEDYFNIIDLLATIGLKYEISSKLESPHNIDQQNELKELFKYYEIVIKNYQEIIRYSIDKYKFSFFKDYISGMDSLFPDLFGREDLERELKSLEPYKDNPKYSYEIKLKNLKLETRRKIKKYKYETIVSALWRIISRAEQFDKTNDWKPFIEELRPHFPKSLSLILNLTEDLLSDSYHEEKWNWDWWEVSDHIHGGGYSSDLAGWISKAISIIVRDILINVSQVNIDTNQYRFTNNTKHFFSGESQFRRILSEYLDKEPNIIFDLPQPDNSKIKSLTKALDSLHQAAIAYRKKSIINQDLSTELIDEFIRIFTTHYQKSSDLRCLIKDVIEIKRYTSSEKAVKYFGTYTLIPRDTFVKEPEINYIDVAESFGRSFSANESKYIYSELIKDITAKSIAECSLDETIERFLTLGSKIDNLLILKSRFVDLEDFNEDGSRIKPYWESKKDYSTYLYRQSKEIPILDIFLEENEAPNGILIIDKIKSFTLTEEVYLELEREGFILKEEINYFFRVEDPKTDKALRKKILETNPEWLKQYKEEDREEFIAEKVAIQIKKFLTIGPIKEHLMLLVPEINDKKSS